MNSPEDILYLIGEMEEGKIEGRVRLMILSFKACNEKDDTYNFSSSHNGPYSRKINEDLKSLERKNLITISEESNPTGNVKYVYELTDKGHKRTNNIENKPIIDSVVEEHGKTPILILHSNLQDERPELFEKLQKA